jgi:hypothetical protein
MISIPWKWAGAAAMALILAGWLPFSQSSQDSPRRFELYTTPGKSLSGPLELLTAEGQIKLTGVSPRMTSTQWLTLRRLGADVPAHPLTAQVVFTSGDRVPIADLSALSIVDGSLSFEPAPPIQIQGSRFNAPKSTVAMIWLGPPPDAAEPSLLLRQLLALEPESDLVRLQQGDKMEGVITALDSKWLKINVRKRETTIPLETIQAIVFRGANRIACAPAGRYTHVVLDNGTRLAVVAAAVKAGGSVLGGRTAFDESVSIPLSNVMALDVRGGVATYLSDIEPSKYTHTAFLGPSWPLVRDGSASGRALKLGNSTWDKGLGTHAECRVVYSLAGNYRWFEARVGLDPVFGKRGRVKVRVLVDGQERDLGGKELTAADGPLQIRVDTRGGKELTLEVLCAGFGDVEAHVNWADARLLK